MRCAVPPYTEYLSQEWARPAINLPYSRLTLTLVGYSGVVELHEEGTSRCRFAARAPKAGLLRAEGALRPRSRFAGRRSHALEYYERQIA